jgi:MFS transporter, ACS family, hexuronate transporter
LKAANGFSYAVPHLVDPATQTRPGFRHYRWLICGLLFYGTSVNYIDRQILSLIKEFLVRDFGINNTQFGAINAAFQLSYAFGLLWFGWLIDRFGTKWGYAISMAAWSVAAAGHALVGSVSGFFAARIALGLGEGGNFPSAIKAVALWFPRRERALATSIFNSGANVGALVAPAIVPVIVEHWGWRAAFVAAGVAGMAWLFLWWPTYDVPEKSRFVGRTELDHIRSDADEERGNAGKVPWKVLLRQRQTWSFITAKFLTDPVWWFFLIWLPGYFNETRGLNISKSWRHLVAIYTIVTVLSILGGWVTGHLNKTGWTVTRARKTGMLVFAFCVLPILVATRVNDWTAVVLIGLAGASHQAWSANLFTTVSDMFPNRAVGSVVGLGGMAGSIGGVLFPLFTGWLLDEFKAAGNITAGYAILFGICALAYLLAFLLNHALAPKFEPIQFRDLQT